MIGQQKRLLEDIASSQPVKYQKHCDDTLSEAHTRVASLTDDKLEFEQHLSAASQNKVFSVSPGASCDSKKVFERVRASELQHAPKKNDTLASSGAPDCSLSNEYELTGSAENPCFENTKESTVEVHGEDMGPSFDGVNKTQVVGSSGEGAAFPPLSGSGGASTCDKSGMNNWSALGSPSRDLTVELFRDQPIGLIQGPSITKVDARQEAVNSRSTQSLPVVLSQTVIDLYVMDEQVQSYGGYEIVTSEGLWGNISELLGLGSDCGPGLKLIYFKYLKQLERGRERERGLPLERHHDTDLFDDVHIRGPGLPNENGLVDDRGESFSLADSEQFAESEPFHEKSGEGQIVNGKSSNVPLDIDHSEDEAEIRSVKRDGEAGKPHSRFRTDSYPFIGSCSFSQACQELPDAFVSDHHISFKGHHHGPGGPATKQKRELGTNVEDQRVVYDVAKIERFKKSLADTLIWIKRIAVEPGNPQMGQGPEGSGQNEKWAAECASQAQELRTVLWRRREDVRWGDGHAHQAKQQIAPPSIYYEDPSRQEQQLPERPRPTRETRERAAHHGSTSAQKPFNESVNYQRSPSPSSNQHPQWAGQTSQRLSRQSHHYLNEERYSEEFHDRPRRRVPVGDDFQSHVPRSNSVDRHRSVVVTEIAGPSGDETQSSDGNESDDSRWLGKQVWPPPGTKKFAFGDDFIARSRPFFCSCHKPESMSCVRLHIEEDRDRLKRELGQAFYIWKFDQMGESVADEWTKDEQHTFQTVVKMNPPSTGKNFWAQLREAFPGKKMKDLVSFYFNVFVPSRRAIQNRLDPQHVDSDDDETIYPESESEDSDDDETHYPDCVDEDESGDEVDEEEYQDGSEDEDESEKEEDRPYGSDSSAKLVEDTGLCGGYSSRLGAISPLDEAQGVQLTVRTARLMNLQDVGHGYHDPHQENEINVRLRTAYMSPKWGHHQRHDDENHLEEELREVKTWEASHWDEADHDDLEHDPVPKGTFSKGEQMLERDPSLHRKAGDGTHQHTTSLVGSGEGEVWGPSMDIAPINKRDKLLSTTGMIQEFFGNESSGLNASN